MRLLILGAPASGKTTLAKHLSTRLNINHIEVDHLYWEAQKGGRVTESFLENVLDKTNQNAWIIEGMAKKTLPHIQNQLTHIYYQRPPYWLVLARTLRRCKDHQNIKEVMININPISFYRRSKLYRTLLKQGIKAFDMPI